MEAKKRQLSELIRRPNQLRVPVFNGTTSGVAKRWRVFMAEVIPRRSYPEIGFSFDPDGAKEALLGTEAGGRVLFEDSRSRSKVKHSWYLGNTFAFAKVSDTEQAESCAALLEATFDRTLMG